MTVKELIKELQNFPQDSKVCGSSDKHQYPADVSIHEARYDEESSEWQDGGEKVVAIHLSY